MTVVSSYNKKLRFFTLTDGQVRFDLRLGGNLQNLGPGDTVRFIVANNIAGFKNPVGGVLKVDVSGQYYLGVCFRCRTRLTLGIVVNAQPVAMGYCPQRGAGSIMLVRELKTGDTLRVTRIGVGNSAIMRPSRFVGFII